ncbi:ABC transporter ATP-binding protein [Amycolatopsis sp. NPDC003676]
MSELLSVQGLEVEFPVPGGAFRVLDDVSFSVRDNEIVGVVGESGSGKSTTVRSVIQLHKPARITGGSVVFNGRELHQAAPKELRRIRGREIGFVAQSPFDALNPVLRIGKQFENVIRAHERASRSEIRTRALELLASTGIPDPARTLDGFPHELSGGMAQRTVIALALSLGPRLLIADEPTTALDLTVQRQVLDLIRGLVRESQRSMLLVTHDLGVVANYCDRVVVMYSGRVVEVGDVATVFGDPRHPYTRTLLDAATTDIRTAAPKSAPAKRETAPGCNFAHRCPRADGVCAEERPPLTVTDPGHGFGCHHPLSIEVTTSAGTSR